MLAALAEQFSRDASWSTPDGGYFVWLDLDGTDTSELAVRADEAGVAFVPGLAFHPRGSGLGGNAARLAFSYETPDRIAEGIALLAALR